MSRRSLPVLLASAVLLLSTGALAGCSDDPATKPAAKPTSSIPTIGADPTENFATGHDYFAALAANDVAGLEKAAGLSAKGSLAAKYAKHLRDQAQGSTQPADLLTALGPGKYKICSGSDTCTTYDAIVLADGKVSSFDVDGKAIDKVLGSR